jgi:hypothetical protein
MWRKKVRTLEQPAGCSSVHELLFADVGHPALDDACHRRPVHHADDENLEQLAYARSSFLRGPHLVDEERFTGDAADRHAAVQARIGVLKDHLHALALPSSIPPRSLPRDWPPVLGCTIVGAVVWRAVGDGVRDEHQSDVVVQDALATGLHRLNEPS